MANKQTLVDSEVWEEIRRKIYFPDGADEYKTSSRSLTELSREAFISHCPKKEKPLKIGYIVDVCREGGVTPCALILGLLYIHRLSLCKSPFLSKVSSTDVFLIAMVVASKYLQDEGEMEAFVNSEWAKIGQLSKSSVDALEMEFLNAIDWQLFVPSSEYFSFVKQIQAKVSCMEAKDRGWWTYTDLVSLWSVLDNKNTIVTTGKEITKTMIGGSLAVYLVTFTALLAAPHIKDTSLINCLDNSCSVHDVINNNFTTPGNSWQNVVGIVINKNEWKHYVVSLMETSGTPFELEPIKHLLSDISLTDTLNGGFNAPNNTNGRQNSSSHSNGSHGNNPPDDGGGGSGRFGTHMKISASSINKRFKCN